MRLSSAIHQFFSKYLSYIKAVSPHTINAYRDTFKLFLPYAASYHGIKISSLQIAHLTVEVVLDFLESLEKMRHNSAKTRNSRLAALKSLAKMIRFMYPDQRQLADRILSIPQKRAQRQLIGFLYPYEIDQILLAVNLKNALGVRDYCNPISYEAPSADRLYHNLGDGRFEDVSESAGIASLRGNGLGVAAFGSRLYTQLPPSNWLRAGAVSAKDDEQVSFEITALVQYTWAGDEFLSEWKLHWDWMLENQKCPLKDEQVQHLFFLLVRQRARLKLYVDKYECENSASRKIGRRSRH